MALCKTRPTTLPTLVPSGELLSPCVPQTADCGARVPCGTLRSCTLAAPMSESSWVLCGHGPLPHSSLPTHPQQPGQAAARILNPGCPSSPQPPFPLWQQDSFVVDLSHTLLLVSTTLLPWIGIHCYESTGLRLLIVTHLPLEAARSSGLSLSLTSSNKHQRLHTHTKTQSPEQHTVE